ncbi:MAG: glycosyltransferase [Candidatus Liptonbacteria bacterium]|nr:glycosyltransferase [Candidatus Liptonbacteria bacterium]
MPGNTMRIAIFSDSFYPEIGGIQDSIIALGTQLAGRGHALFYYVPRHPKRHYTIAKLPYGEISLGPNIHIRRFFAVPYPGPTRQASAVIPTGLRWIAMQKEKFDVIHTQTFFGVGLEALAAAKFLRVPIVGTNHWAISEFKHYSPIARELFSRWSVRYASWYYNHCSYVTGPSRSVIGEMIKNGLTRPHGVVSNPIDTATFRPVTPKKKGELKKKLGLSRATIVYAGRLAQEKKIDVILRAIPLIKKKIPAITLAIAGHGSALPELRQMITRTNIEREVKFFGTLSKPLLAELYQASEVFVIMSTSETQSMVLLQAMACGLPAIAADWRALPEYVNENNGFLVPPGNERLLAERFTHLMGNPALRESLGKGAHASVQNFSPEKIAARWETIYDNAIKNFGHAAPQNP